MLFKGGILEPNDPDYKRQYTAASKGLLPFRMNHISWWKEELPTVEEMEEGRRNLEKYQNKVD